MLRGVDGVRHRMAELQARMDSLNPRPPTVSAPSTPNFADVLNSKMPGPLQGQIGGSSFAPLNPLALGVQSNFSEGQLRMMASDAAVRNGLDPDLFSALVEQESAFNPGARSLAGAMGLTQLMPDTAKSLGVNDPFDPNQNLEGGAKYLSQLLDKFGDVRLALAAYNAGPGTVEKYGRAVPPYAETQKYVEGIMARYNRS